MLGNLMEEHSRSWVTYWRRYDQIFRLLRRAKRQKWSEMLFHILSVMWCCILRLALVIFKSWNCLLDWFFFFYFIHTLWSWKAQFKWSHDLKHVNFIILAWLGGSVCKPNQTVSVSQNELWQETKERFKMDEGCDFNWD